MRATKKDNWLKFVPLVQHSINTSLHSTLKYQTPYRVLFGRDPVKGFRDLSIPDEIAQDLTTEEELIGWVYKSWTLSKQFN